MARKSKFISLGSGAEIAPDKYELPGGLESDKQPGETCSVDYVPNAQDAAINEAIAQKYAQPRGLAPTPSAGVPLMVTSAAIERRAEVCRQVARNAISDLESAPADARLVCAINELEALAKIIPMLADNTTGGE